MSDPGMGQPVDALDGLCKQYKDCLKCARMEHGESCLGEMVKYGFLTDDQTNRKISYFSAIRLSGSLLSYLGCHYRSPAWQQISRVFMINSK